ncbi:hypothetical protein A3J15_03650 [Candidatus Roizmanbacteria bacterium RIFCSPLOWO2_02_FULL_38_10]|uniref:Sortase n=1 Tax=Candidatus Roizmanbacteria bacterium RIFCSPLOWO2_02_FULL_38_10 TaxID=1802074 RepID=A0A1F7JJV2_9BACT|nr:MAG: hypothetical protein A3J15_03650 [Candidatus Roizmanbacteria bacterium RIFCSPLOWO2_02_FULL_38_10]
MQISTRALTSILIINTILLLTVGLQLIESTKQNQNSLFKPFSSRLDFPQSLFIPKLKINKSIIPGGYDFQQKTWNISTNYVHFAVLSAMPSSKHGNTVIYAHNSRDLFSRINQFSTQDRVILKTKNGKEFIYEYLSQKDVIPTDISVFTNDGLPQLVLLTCTGENNSLRRLVYFRLLNEI